MPGSHEEEMVMASLVARGEEYGENGFLQSLGHGPQHMPTAFIPSES